MHVRTDASPVFETTYAGRFKDDRISPDITVCFVGIGALGFRKRSYQVKHEVVSCETEVLSVKQCFTG